MKINLTKILLYAGLLAIAFAALIRSTSMPTHRVAPRGGVADLTALDLSARPARIAAAGWEYYPGQLYDPADFARGVVDAPRFVDDETPADHGTYRLTVKLPPGKIYAMTGRSFPFSQRVFIDGALVDATGVPGPNAAATTPRTRTYDLNFLPRAPSTEIVFQAASFHHRAPARNEPVVIAEPAAAARYRALEMIRVNIAIGCLVTMFFYLTGVFVFFPRRAGFLYLGLACLTTAARLTFIGEKHIMEVFPGLSWFAAIRLEYLCLVLFVVFLLLYFSSLFPKMLSGRFVSAIVLLSAAYGLLTLFGETPLFTGMLKWYTPVWAAAAAATVWGVARRLLRGGDMRATLVFIGLAAFVATAAFDEAAAWFLGDVRLHNTLIGGVLVCVFMNMIALILSFSETERALAETRLRHQELDETNRLLDRLNDMKTRFVANASHEMKTPLTVISVHAQLAKTLLTAGGDADEIGQSLDAIFQESGRLARMVGGVLRLSSMHEAKNDMTALDVAALTRHSAESYRVLIEKQGNTLTIDIPDRPVEATGDADMLTQVMFNLLANANRHTRGGTIAVAMTTGDDAVAVTVRDSGGGVEPRLLPRIFERNVRDERSGGAGLGLPICRVIVERHEGTIAMENTPDGGAAVRFVLPLRQGGSHEG